MKNKITYITFNEPVNGVYISQVIEVVEHIMKTGMDIKVFAFFSLRDYFKNRKLLKHYLPGAIALPSLGRLKNWKSNSLWLQLFKRRMSNQTIICRGPIATNLAIDNLKNARIIYDGRGAVWAEQKEYGVYNGSGIENELFEIEKKAVTQSQRQIAVSSKLINYWQENFNFSGNRAIVIPCTLNTTKNEDAENIPEDLISFFDYVNQQNYTVTVFAGGNGKWQQIDKICEFALESIEKQESSAFLFLCPPDKNIQDLKNKFPARVFNTLVSPDLVHTILSKCDYGIILREQNTTNKVASPVKVAEYLFAGLKVIISPDIGDYSNMVKENDLGVIWTPKGETPYLPKPDIAERQRNILFVEKHLSKSVFNFSDLIIS
ncbi:glycosyl transferase [Anaerophaga thermohalophila]|uniref:glycosyl transferase n=1 Tax=Anaerophaga thermohalophila TaxID=177400 RepID=UPI000237BCF9|nr:glycosyl transferase [Anaerophaga thermohalophila]